MKEEKRAGDEKMQWVRSLSLVGTLGIIMLACIGVGFGIGFLLDRWLGSSPTFVVAFLIVGVAAGMMRVYKMVMKTLE